MAGAAAGLQNRAALQQQLLQRGLVTKAAYSPGYQVIRPDGHLQQRGEFTLLLLVCCVATVCKRIMPCYCPCDPDFFFFSL